MKYIKENIGFIIAMIVLGAIAFNPQLKSYVLQGLMKTGLFNPDVDRPSEAATSGKKLGLAPSASFHTSSGESLDISKLKGKVVFLNFWTTWCPPCIAEMPGIQALKNSQNTSEVLFLMVDADSDFSKSKAFMKKHGYNFTVYAPSASIPETVFKGSLPTTLIINKEGEIVFHHEGIADYNTDEMKDLLRDLTK